jgi:hypothetical protein
MGVTNFDSGDEIQVGGRPISTGALRLVGSIDCSGNPNYPLSKAGDVRKVSVAGKIGGGSGKKVSVGDLITCVTDSVAGTQAAVGANFVIEEANIELAAGEVIAKGTPAASIADAAQTSVAPAVITAAGGEPTAAALADTQALQATVAALVTDVGTLTTKLNLALAALDAFGVTL